MTRPMHFNVMLNTLNRDDSRSGWAVRRFTKAVELAEELNFDGVWLGNSYAQGGPDSFIALAHVVSVSERLRIGTSVFLLPTRHPTTVAYEVATLDAMSEGRLLLGVGVGGERGADFTLHGMSPSERGARMDETLEVMPRLWAGEELDHHGRFYDIQGRLKMLPAQDPMPVLMGARGGASPQLQRVYRRVVERAQGWLPYIMTPSGYARGLEAIRALGGGDEQILGLVEMTYVGGGDGAATVEDAAIREAEGYGGTPEQFRRLVLAGNVQMVVDRMNEFADLGCTEFVFNWACPPEAVEEQMRILAAEVIPAVKEHAAQRAG